MFKFVLLFALLALAAAFSPRSARAQSRLQVSMKADKVITSAIIGASFLAAPAFAVEGASPKQSFFGDSDLSSPYTVNENREDPIYSPYSPYGDGSKAVYKQRAGSKEEVAFWKNQFETASKRVDNVPKFLSKKSWTGVQTELTSYSYNLREAMLRLASYSKNPTEATAAAKTYFSDLNDILEFASKKDAGASEAAYKKSLADIAAYKKLI